VRPALAAALLLALPAPAGAQEPGEPGPPPDLDFELLPADRAASEPPIDLALELEVNRRRRMLGVHQGLGIATWTAMAGTVVLGQLDFDDRFRGGGDTGRYHGWHRGLAYGTAALFTASAALALLAPEPYAKKSRLDTATVHKVSMAVAAAGLAAQIALGVWARSLEGELSERDVAAAHQVLGYATLGAMTVGAVVFVF
jgi:hypothetical protein